MRRFAVTNSSPQAGAIDERSARKLAASGPCPRLHAHSKVQLRFGKHPRDALGEPGITSMDIAGRGGNMHALT